MEFRFNNQKQRTKGLYERRNKGERWRTMVTVRVQVGIPNWVARGSLVSPLSALYASAAVLQVQLFPSRNSSQYNNI